MSFTGKPVSDLQSVDLLDGYSGLRAQLSHLLATLVQQFVWPGIEFVVYQSIFKAHLHPHLVCCIADQAAVPAQWWRNGLSCCGLMPPTLLPRRSW